MTLLALGFPATFGNAVVGQNGFLTAGLFPGGCFLLDKRPLPADAVGGVMAYKPQFFPLVFVALMASGRGQAALYAVVSIVLLSAVTLPLFGLQSWDAFIHTARASSQSIYSGELTLAKLQSVSGLLLRVGVPVFSTQLLQAVVALACAGFVVWLWRRDVPFEYLELTGLATAILLATPYSYPYDLTLLGLAAIWLGLRFQKDGWWPGDAEALLLAWLTPLSYFLLGLSIAPVTLVLFVALLMRDSSGKQVARNLLRIRASQPPLNSITG